MADAKNSVFMGTSVVSGSASVLICATGPNTSLGKISDTLVAKAPFPSFEQGTQRFGLLVFFYLFAVEGIKPWFFRRFVEP